MLQPLANWPFRHRSYTPIPLLVILWVASRTTEPWLLAGAGVVLVGEATRIWALRHSGPKTRTHRKIRVDDLVVTGPYSITRNPLYIGNFVMSLGVALASGQPLVLPLLLVAFVFQYAFIIRAEEAFLEGEIGEPYREYKQRVPRILPRLGAYDAGARRFGWMEILPRELNTITAAQTVLALLGLRIIFPQIPVLFPEIFGP